MSGRVVSTRVFMSGQSSALGVAASTTSGYPLDARSRPPSRRTSAVSFALKASTGCASGWRRDLNSVWTKSARRGVCTELRKSSLEVTRDHRFLPSSNARTRLDRANNALEATDAVVKPHIAAAQTPAILLAPKAVSAVTRPTTAVIMDWADTPDVRDRYTRETRSETVSPRLLCLLHDLVER